MSVCARGGWGGVFDDKFVYINIVCCDVGCFYLGYEMYARPRTDHKTLLLPLSLLLLL